WRGLETWHGIGLSRRASPRPYLGARGGEIPPRDSLAALSSGRDLRSRRGEPGDLDPVGLGWRDGGGSAIGASTVKTTWKYGTGSSGLPVGQPLSTRQPLALRAVPVAAGIVGDAKLAAAVALFDMTAQRCRTTGFDGADDAALAAAQMAGMGLTVSGAVAAENIRHLQ